MTCDDCIHKSVCYRRIESVSPFYADKCGDFESDNSIEPFKPMVEIDLYSVIKQKYIEREVLDKIRAEIDRQQKWLLQAGYTAYNVDIAFDAIKAVVAEQEDT